MYVWQNFEEKSILKSKNPSLQIHSSCVYNRCVTFRKTIAILITIVSQLYFRSSHTAHISREEIYSSRVEGIFWNGTMFAALKRRTRPLLTDPLPIDRNFETERNGDRGERIGT